MRWTTSLFKLTLISLSVVPRGGAQQASDRCHVYIAAHGDEDAKAILKLFGEVSDPKELERRMAAFVKTLGEFGTTRGEEEATTKSYAIPGTAQFVTVTVFYTDESMAAEGVGSDSMLLSLAIANRRLDSAQGVPGCAQAEVSAGKFAGKIRVKKVAMLNGKEYLIGLECERK